MSPSIDLNNSQTLIFIARQEYVTSVSMRLLISDSVLKKYYVNSSQWYKGGELPPLSPHTLSPRLNLHRFRVVQTYQGIYEVVQEHKLIN